MTQFILREIIHCMDFLIQNRLVRRPCGIELADHYWGLLMPAGVGSVAVVSHTEMSLEEPARNVVRALEAALDYRDREAVHVSVLGSYSREVL